MYSTHVYPERHLLDFELIFFKVNFARGGVTFCIVNGFVT